MQLEPKTLQKMAACFAGQRCRRCGGPAERLAHGRFYCRRHYPPARSTRWLAIPKVYHCNCAFSATR